MTAARLLLHNRDAKFSEAFDAGLRHAGLEPIKLPPQSPIERVVKAGAFANPNGGLLNFYHRAAA